MRRLCILMRPLAFAVVLVILSGCDKGTGEVSGKVIFDGKPLPGGMVTFIPENGKAEGVRIGEDGSYKVTNIPVGLARITVTTQEPVQFRGSKKGPMEPLGKYVAIPPRYREAENSGLSLDVKKGAQQYEIPLTP